MANKIIVHWTGGALKPNKTDKLHYHYLIDSAGNVSKGTYTVLDNDNCYDGRYAQHTGGGNTKAIGVAVCGMYVPPKTPAYKTQYPLTAKQCERLFKLIAELSIRYGIPIDSAHVMTHYEFGLSHPKTESRGKIDIIYLPPWKTLKADAIGNFIRGKALWYKKHLK